jgi:hypothetical protein
VARLAIQSDLFSEFGLVLETGERVLQLLLEPLVQLSLFEAELVSSLFKQLLLYFELVLFPHKLLGHLVVIVFVLLLVECLIRLHDFELCLLGHDLVVHAVSLAFLGSNLLRRWLYKVKM